MKVINKIFLVIICLFLTSCKTASLVNFESVEFENFKNNTNKDSFPDEFYFTRIMTTVDVDIIFKRFSKNRDFNAITVKNIILTDDSGNVLYKKECITLESYAIEHQEDNIPYEIYSYEINNEELDRLFLKNYKTKFIIINYEIDGKQYSEKLNYDEKKMLILPT